MPRVIQDSDDDDGDDEVIGESLAKHEPDILYLGERDVVSSTESEETLAKNITKAHTALFDDEKSSEAPMASTTARSRTASRIQIEVVIPSRRPTSSREERPHLDGLVNIPEHTPPGSPKPASTKAAKATTRKSSKGKRKYDESTIDELSLATLPQRRNSQQSSPASSKVGESQLGINGATPAEIASSTPATNSTSPYRQAEEGFEAESTAKLTVENANSTLQVTPSPAKQSRRKPKQPKRVSSVPDASSRPPEDTSLDSHKPVSQDQVHDSDQLLQKSLHEVSSLEKATKHSDEHLNADRAEGNKENIIDEPLSSLKAKPKLESRPQVTKPAHRVGLSRYAQLPSLLKTAKK